MAPPSEVPPHLLPFPGIIIQQWEQWEQWLKNVKNACPFSVMTNPAPLDALILTIRGQEVILDADLADIYGVPTKRLNEQVKRNADRFPEDFRFQLTRKEAKEAFASRSQIATLKRGQNIKYLPHAFTEHGALMAANVLNSPEAVKMSVHVVRAFIKQRELIAGQAEILKKLAQMDAKLLKHDDALRLIWRELQPLLAPPPVPTKKQIGFHVQESAISYRVKRATGAKSKRNAKS